MESPARAVRVMGAVTVVREFLPAARRHAPELTSGQVVLRQEAGPLFLGPSDAAHGLIPTWRRRRVPAPVVS